MGLHFILFYYFFFLHFIFIFKFFLNFGFILFIYLWLCWVFVSVRGPLFIAVCGPLTVVASLDAEHRLQTCRLSSCGSRA